MLQITSKILEKWRPILDKMGLSNEDDRKTLALFAETVSIEMNNNYASLSGAGMGSVSVPIQNTLPYQQSTNSENNFDYLPISLKTLKDIVPFICIKSITTKEFKPIIRKFKIDLLLSDKLTNKVVQNITFNNEYDAASHAEVLLSKKVISKILFNIIDNVKTLDPHHLNKDDLAYELKSLLNNDFAKYVNTNLSLIVNNDFLYDYMDREDEVLISDSFKYLGKFNNIKVYRNVNEYNDECYIINKSGLKEDGLILTTDVLIKHIELIENKEKENHDLVFLLNYMIEKNGDNPLNGFKRLQIQ